MPSGRNVQMKPSSPQVKAREGKEKSGPTKQGTFYEKSKGGDDNTTVQAVTTNTQKVLTNEYRVQVPSY